VKEFDIFVPLFFNDGRPIGSDLFQLLQDKLLAEFDGLTYFPQQNKGFWKMGGVVYEDEIVIYRVLSKNAKRARRMLTHLKRWMKSEFEQEEILIIERNVGTVE